MLLMTFVFGGCEGGDSGGGGGGGENGVDIGVGWCYLCCLC